MGDITNLPTVGGDEGTWGQELNDALNELDTKKASRAEIYTQAQSDVRYVRTVNGQGPDDAGNVAVAGGTGAVSSVNTKTGDVTLTASDVGARSTSTQVPAADVSGLATVATSGAYGDLTGTPAAAVPLTDKGASSGVATLGSDGKVPSSQLSVPSSSLSDATATGKAVLTATDATAGRSALSALGTGDVPAFDMVNAPVAGNTPVWDDIAGQFTYAAPSTPPVDNFALRGVVLNPGESIPADFPAGGLVFVRDSAPTLGVQAIGANGTNSSTSSISVTLTDGVATNEDIFVAFTAAAPGSVLSTVTITDTAASSYINRGQRLQGATLQTQLYKARPGSAIASGSTVTVTLGAAVGDIEVIVFKASGLTTSAFDQSGNNSSLSATSLPITAGGSTVQSNEIALCIFGFNQASNALVLPTGWTQVGSTQTSGGTNPRYCSVMWKQLTTISTPSVTPGTTVAGVLVGLLATFKGV